MPLCSFKQFRISSALDDGRALPTSLQRHVDSCANCREFLANSQTIGDQLAPQGDYEAPPWLHTRVMSSVLSGKSAPTAENRVSAWLPAAVGVAAIAIVVCAIALNTGGPTDDPTPTTPDKIALTAPTPPIYPASVPARLERGAKLALGNEFNNLAADISGAKNFISASLRNTIPGLRE